jgi:hypothetical protein
MRMLSRNHRRRTLFVGLFASLAVLAALTPMQLRAQDDDNPKPEVHGRKYKPPPETSHIEVTVVKGFNKKPIDGAHVIFHPTKDGVDEGNLEVKTHQDGKVSIDVIPTGSKVTIQVLADGFSTYAGDYQINEASREITIPMIKPRAQISTYIDNDGKPSEVQPGIQQPIRPKKTAKPATPPAATSTSAPPASDSSTSGSKPQ